MTKHRTTHWRKLYLRQLSVLGATMGTAAEARQRVSWVEQGALKPLLHETFSLPDLALAQAFFLRQQHFGKLVISL